MTDMLILGQAVRNTIRRKVIELKTNHAFFGDLAEAIRIVHEDFLVFPEISCGHVRDEYRRLLQAESNIIEFPASEMDQLIGSGTSRL